MILLSCSDEAFMVYLPLGLSRPPLKITAECEAELKHFRMAELEGVLPWSRV